MFLDQPMCSLMVKPKRGLVGLHPWAVSLM